MKAPVKLQPIPSTSNVVARLVLLGGFVLGSMYVILMAFATLTKLIS